MFLGCPWTSEKLPGKAILSGLWSLNSQVVTNASHLYQYVWPVLSNLNARIKTSLEKSDGVKWEFKAEPDCWLNILDLSETKARKPGCVLRALQLRVSQGKLRV